MHLIDELSNRMSAMLEKFSLSRGTYDLVKNVLVELMYENL